ncbi:RHS repeat-associated core domain-containing protein [Roseateles sp. NT4]|uniref:RHS repeat-associated core domain-containing protein n=1 Tax=Roseateles sp. NT4 TaxID=3453715 RepID=UPI003EE8423F
MSKYEYDANGNPTKRVVAPSTKAYATKDEYDALGRRKKSTNAKNGVTDLGYDLLDQLTSVTDPKRLITQYKPTGLGDVEQLVSPDTGTANGTFDAAGNVKTSTDARGVLATWDFDELNRPKQVVYSKAGNASRTIIWTYDQTGASFGYGVGRLTTAATPDANTTFRYDALGHVTMTVQTANGYALVVNSEYDLADHLTKLTYPSGRVVDFGWANGQPQSVKVTAGTTAKTVLNQITQSPFGPIKSWVWQFAGTPKTHTREFDTNGRMVRHPLGPLVRDLTYDDADRISRYTHYTAATAVAAPAYDQVFGYDELNRLTSVTGGSINYGYTYDANGTRLTTQAGSTTRTFTVSATSNRIDSRTDPARNWGYDLAGNTTSDIQAGASSNHTSTYGLEGRWAAMSQGSSLGAVFGYDAMGRRVTRGQWAGSPSNPRTYTLFAYDGSNHLIGEYTSTGAPISEYVWLGDIPVAVIKSDATAPGGFLIYAIHTDHLDTPRVIVDAQGNVRWRWMGEAFGATPAEEQPTAGLAALQQNLRFPGQQYEPLGGRHYNHFRDYDPTVGRYVQSDPIGLGGGINTYAYVRGNPLSRSDSLGLLDVFVGGAMDGTSRIVASYQEAYAAAYADRASSYFEWDQGNMAIEAILAARLKNKCEPINIIGHSYGGSTAASISRALREAGIDVNLLVTVDPVSRVWSRGAGAAGTWANVNATPSSSNGFTGDAWAALGGKWGDWPKGKANPYYQAPFHHNEFASMLEFVPPGGKSALQLLLDANSSSCTCPGNQ